jgi:thiol-disulfide isomerase/thioredoxin
MHRIFLAGALFGALALGQTAQLGSAAPAFTVTGLSGKPATFASFRGDVTVVMFVATKCPISNDYNERMKSLYSDYSAKGVKFVFVNSNVNEPAAEVAEHAKSAGFPFAVYKDEGSVVAAAYGAQVTPEAYLIDKAGILRYHGHIDDSRNAARIQKQSLRMALDAVLRGAEVTAPETKAFGCTIKRPRKAS